MTDTITPASLREAAKVNAALGWAEQAQICLAQADEMEAESARDEEAERLAKVYHEAGCIAGWDELHQETRARRVGWMRAVLDRLAADGRLLPEGGTGAAQERLRRNPETIARVQKAQAERHLDVRVEVAPPAAPDVREIGWYRTMTPVFATEHFNFPIPTAEKHVASDGGKWVFDGQLEQWELREYPPAEPVSDSGPDGTPEKPWPTWQDVPEGVKYSSARYTYLRPCVNLRGHRYFITDDGAQILSGVPDSEMAERAPFVRVDGDQA